MARFNLEHFVSAQTPVIAEARRELAAGRKHTHWMWFIFPQIAGLGLSPMSRQYALSGLDEARAYLAHPILGPRLRECLTLAMAANRPALEIFGAVDAQKLRSCLTLFAAAGADPLFPQALAQFFGGTADPATLTRLAG